MIPEYYEYWQRLKQMHDEARRLRRWNNFMTAGFIIVAVVGLVTAIVALVNEVARI